MKNLIRLNGMVGRYLGISGRHMGILGILLLVSGCSLSLFNGYKANPQPPDISPVSWFTSDTGHYLFNTKIDLLKNHFSGLMVIKPVSADHYRAIFITEMGLKIFDMEFYPGTAVKVHYVMEAIDRKALMNTLSNDISLVLMNEQSMRHPDVLTQKGSRDLIFRYAKGNRRSYYYLHETFDKPYLARQTRCLSNKVRADLYGNPGSGIDSVKIEHYNLRLTINLYRIQENGLASE